VGHEGPLPVGQPRSDVLLLPLYAFGWLVPRGYCIFQVRPTPDTNPRSIHAKPRANRIRIVTIREASAYQYCNWCSVVGLRTISTVLSVLQLVFGGWFAVVVGSWCPVCALSFPTHPCKLILNY